MKTRDFDTFKDSVEGFGVGFEVCTSEGVKLDESREAVDQQKREVCVAKSAVRTKYLIYRL